MLLSRGKLQHTSRSRSQIGSMSSLFPFSAVLLAGGRSSRMGRDKAEIEWNHAPLWKHQLATLQAVAPAELLISGRRDGPCYEAGISIVEDRVPGCGPLGGIAAALAVARYDILLVLAIDLPRIPATLFRALVEHAAATGQGIVPELHGELQPVSAVYTRACRPLAEAMLTQRDHSLHRFVRACTAQNLLAIHTIPPVDAGCFLNLNKPSDLPAT